MWATAATEVARRQNYGASRRCATFAPAAIPRARVLTGGAATASVRCPGRIVRRTNRRRGDGAASGGFPHVPAATLPGTVAPRCCGQWRAAGAAGQHARNSTPALRLSRSGVVRHLRRAKLLRAPRRTPPTPRPGPSGRGAAAPAGWSTVPPQGSATDGGCPARRCARSRPPARSRLRRTGAGCRSRTVPRRGVQSDRRAQHAAAGGEQRRDC